MDRFWLAVGTVRAAAWTARGETAALTAAGALRVVWPGSAVVKWALALLVLIAACDNGDLVARLVAHDHPAQAAAVRRMTAQFADGAAMRPVPAERTFAHDRIADPAVTARASMRPARRSRRCRCR